MNTQSTYSYRSRDAGGRIVNGTMVAGSAEEVGTRLRADGKFIVSIDDRPLRATTPTDARQIRRSEAARRVRREDVIAICQQLSVMLETGVPLGEALEALDAQAPRREVAMVVTALRGDVLGGEPLSTAMARWPRVFPAMMISLMRASEASGTMSMMLGRVGGYLASERRTMRQVRGALAYPMFMLVSSGVMLGFLMAFVLPRFATIYEQRAARLPAPTLLLLGVSDFLTGQYMIYGPSVVLSAVAAWLWLRHPAGRRALDWLRLRLPLVGRMYRQLHVTRMTRTMATLLAAGVNLLDIIELCRGVTRNSYYEQFWDELESGIREGRKMSDTIVGSPLIPPNVASMIASAERSGRLAPVMERVAEFTDEALGDTVKQVTAFIEPVMIMIMGLVVGGIALALLLPVFSMGQIMSGG